MFGPTYDLEFTVAATDLKALQEAISSFPEFLPWKSREGQSRSILCPRDASFRPVGLLLLHSTRDAIAGCSLVMYPPIIRHACGLEVWQNPKTEVNILALRELHHSLLELVRWVHVRVPVIFSSVHDETYSVVDLEDAQGFLWLDNEIAGHIGWTGRVTEYWTGIAL